MKKNMFLLLSLFLISCGGGGGSSPKQPVQTPVQANQLCHFKTMTPEKWSALLESLRLSYDRFSASSNGSSPIHSNPEVTQALIFMNAMTESLAAEVDSVIKDPHFLELFKVLFKANSIELSNASSLELIDLQKCSH